MSAANEFGEGTVEIVRVFDAPRALVWQAWTDPKMMAQWFGPRGFTSTVPELDLRVGGALRIVMHGHGNDYPMIGTFLEIVAPERLVFTFAWEDGAGLPQYETLVTVSLEDLGARTRLTLHQAVFQSDDVRDEHVAGWTGCLERFADFMATNTVS